MEWGGTYPCQYFLIFWEGPSGSTRRRRPGGTKWPTSKSKTKLSNSWSSVNGSESLHSVSRAPSVPLTYDLPAHSADDPEWPKTQEPNPNSILEPKHSTFWLVTSSNFPPLSHPKLRSVQAPTARSHPLLLQRILLFSVSIVQLRINSKYQRQSRQNVICNYNKR